MLFDPFTKWKRLQIIDHLSYRPEFWSLDSLTSINYISVHLLKLKRTFVSPPFTPFYHFYWVQILIFFLKVRPLLSMVTLSIKVRKIFQKDHVRFTPITLLNLTIQNGYQKTGMLIFLFVCLQIFSTTFQFCTFSLPLICAFKYLAKFMMECRSLWNINYLLIKQRDSYSVIKTVLTHKFFRVSCCASAVCILFIKRLDLPYEIHTGC